MQRSEDQPETDLSDVAEEPPETSTETEQQVVGEDQHDAGGTVPPDQAQSARDPQEEAAVDDPQPLLGGMMSSDRPESSTRD